MFLFVFVTDCIEGFKKLHALSEQLYFQVLYIVQYPKVEFKDCGKHLFQSADAREVCLDFNKIVFS